MNLQEALINKNEITEFSLALKNITIVPEEIQELTQLEILNLSSNQLTELPEWIGSLTNLKQLLLDHNQLVKLPKSINNLVALENLSVNKNKLVELPDLSKLINLRFCLCSFNQLTKFPVLNSPNLFSIELEQNKLTEIPDTIKDNSSLHKLNFAHNQLTTISSNIQYLENLSTLILKYNQLTILPNIFDKLQELGTLEIENNQLEELPITLFESAIYHFKIKNNPFKKLPFELYLRDNQKNLNLENCNFNYAFAKDHKKLSNLFIKNNFTVEDIAIIHDLYGNKTQHYLLSTFFKYLHLNFDTLQKNILNAIYTHSQEDLTNNPLQKGAIVTLLGKSNFDKSELKERLTKVGVKYVTKITTKTTHVIVGKGVKKYDNFDQERLIFISDDDVNNFLNQVDTLYLDEEDTNTDHEINNVKSLLFSLEKDNVALGIKLLQSLGGSADCLTELLLVIKNIKFPSALRTKAKKLFLLHASEQVIHKVERDKSQPFIAAKVVQSYQLSTRICTFSNTEIDLLKIFLYINMERGEHFQFETLLSYLKREECILFLNQILSERHDYYLKDRFIKDKSIIYELKNLHRLEITFPCEEIPTEIFQLTSLKFLRIENTGLKTISTKVNSLPNLEKLFLPDNLIEEVPLEVKNNSQLELDLYGNPCDPEE